MSDEFYDPIFYEDDVETVAVWADFSVCKKMGGILTATHMYEAYCDFCSQLRVEPVKYRAFSSELVRYGLSQTKINGRACYLNVHLSAA
ncbi:MAG: hypothetical protein ACR2PG_25725 [Hyphomicrobiaceae bacterium]